MSLVSIILSLVLPEVTPMAEVGWCACEFRETQIIQHEGEPPIYLVKHHAGMLYRATPEVYDFLTAKTSSPYKQFDDEPESAQPHVCGLTSYKFAAFPEPILMFGREPTRPNYCWMTGRGDN